MKLYKIMFIIVLGFLLIHTNVVASSDQTIGSFELKKVPELQNLPSDRFPGDPAEHKAVYMWNSADKSYQISILNSIQAMIKRYGDNVDIAVVAIGPGLHVLAKEPKRKVDPLTYERIGSFAKDYNVRWIACGNTMNTIGWSDSNMRPFAEYAEVGAAALMELQEEGYKPLIW